LEKNNQKLTGKIVNNSKFYKEDIFVFISENGDMFLITNDSRYNKLCNKNQITKVKGDLSHKYGMFRCNHKIKIKKMKCIDN
jgi:hypothetical protein